MDAVKEEVYTIDDIYALPDGQRAELIDGQIYYMAPPGWKHQRLVQFFCREIGNYIQSNNGKCEVLPAPFAVFLNKDDINYLEPDISVICDSFKLDEKGCHGAPDWIIEIVSPTSKTRDYYKKLIKYGTAGVKEYWIVDPDTKITTVYEFEKDTVEQYAFGKDVPVGIFKEFSIKVEQEAIKITIQQKIDIACSAAGISRAELTRRLGTSESAFKQRLDRGKFKQEELETIASILGCKYFSGFEFPDGLMIKQAFAKIAMSIFLHLFLYENIKKIYENILTCKNACAKIMCVQMDYRGSQQHKDYLQRKYLLHTKWFVVISIN